MVELQLVLVDPFGLLVRFGFELCWNAKQNTSNRTIIDVHVYMQVNETMINNIEHQ